MLVAAIGVCFSTFGNPYESKTEAAAKKADKTCCEDTVVVATPEYTLADGRRPLRDRGAPAGAKELRIRPMADSIPAY